MSPLVDRSTGEEVSDEGVTVEIPAGLFVRRVTVKHGEVSLFDAEGRESVLVQRPTHPGAGLSCNFGDHVETRRV